MATKYDVILTQAPTAGMQAIITAQGERPRYLADFKAAIDWIARQTEMERRLSEGMRSLVREQVASKR